MSPFSLRPSASVHKMRGPVSPGPTTALKLVEGLLFLVYGVNGEFWGCNTLQHGESIKASDVGKEGCCFVNCWGGVMWAHLHDLALGSWMGRHFPSTPGTYSHLFKVDEGSRTKESCSSVWILLRWMHRSTMDGYAVVVCRCKEVSDQSDGRMKC